MRIFSRERLLYNIVLDLDDFIRTLLTLLHVVSAFFAPSNQLFVTFCWTGTMLLCVYKMAQENSLI